MATAYLEIGSCRDDTFNRVRADLKFRVNPESGGTLSPASDEFFATNEQCFDVIFIDGVHRCEQVLRDVDNSLQALNPGGVVVLHDCLPTKREYQLRDPITRAWTGDVWRAMFALRQRPDLDSTVIDSDWGLGIVLPRANTALLPPMHSCDWEDSRQYLRVISPNQLDDFLGSSIQLKTPESRENWFLQVLVTRFNVGVVDEKWLRHRFDFFERFTLPSVREQSERRFQWVLQGDGGTPVVWKNRLESLIKDDSRFSVVWSKQSGKRTLGLLPETKEHIVSLCGSETHLVTSRCDSDDALGIHFMRRIREAILPVSEPEFLDFPLGRQWGDGKTRHYYRPRNAFQTLVEPLNSSVLPEMAYCINHVQSDKRFPVRELEADTPMWLQVCHDLNLANRWLGDHKEP
ncbi:hypothetical protein GYB59_02785 [bacterium]|nr:hypothetical protein [bacterium]